MEPRTGLSVSRPMHCMNWPRAACKSHPSSRPEVSVHKCRALGQGHANKWPACGCEMMGTAIACVARGAEPRQHSKVTVPCIEPFSQLEPNISVAVCVSGVNPLAFDAGVPRKVSSGKRRSVGNGAAVWRLVRGMVIAPGSRFALGCKD